MKTTILHVITITLIALGTMATTAQADLVLLSDDFSTGATPPDQGRVYDSLLDSGWNATSGYGTTNIPSAWDITGGQLENPTAVAPTTGGSYTESESPVWQWWTNPVAGSSSATTLDVSFDYGVGTGDTLTAHFWAVEQGGTPTTTKTWFTNNQGWLNGNSNQNEITSAGGNTPWNLSDGTNAPSTSGNITGSLTGTGTFTGTIDLSTLAITGVSTVGDIDTFFIAFAMNEVGGGTTFVDNLIVTTVPEPTSVAMFGLALAGLGFRRRR